MAKLSLLARINEKLWNEKLDVDSKSRYEYYSHFADCRSDRSYCKRFIICLTCLCFPLPACKQVNAEYERCGAQKKAAAPASLTIWQVSVRVILADIQ